MNRRAPTILLLIGLLACFAAVTLTAGCGSTGSTTSGGGSSAGAASAGSPKAGGFLTLAY
jgi:hypothetical protein